MGNISAVVKRTSPAIPGHFESTVVTVKVAMMELVMVGTKRQYQSVFSHNPLVPSMRRCRRQREVLQMENDQQRI